MRKATLPTHLWLSFLILTTFFFTTLAFSQTFNFAAPTAPNGTSPVTGVVAGAIVQGPINVLGPADFKNQVQTLDHQNKDQLTQQLSQQLSKQPPNTPPDIPQARAPEEANPFAQQMPINAMPTPPNPSYNPPDVMSSPPPAPSSSQVTQGEMNAGPVTPNNPPTQPIYNGFGNPDNYQNQTAPGQANQGIGIKY